MRPWIWAAMAGVLGWMAGCGGASRAPAPELPPETTVRTPTEASPTLPVPPPPASEPPPATEPVPPSPPGSTVCEGLLPDKVTPTRLDVSVPRSEACGGPLAMDGAGSVAYSSRYIANGTYEWNVVDPDGTERPLSVGNPSPALWPQARGFQGITTGCGGGGYGDMDFRVLEGTGQIRSRYAIARSFNFGCETDEFDAAPDPTGGTTAAWFVRPRTTAEGEPPDPSFQVRLQRFEVTGQPRFTELAVASWPPASRGPIAIVVGTDTRGRTLVLWTGDALFGTGTTAGRWLEADGSFLTPVFQAQVPAFLPDRQIQVLTPLYGGGLVLQVDGRWTHGFASGDPRAGAPPDWLAGRQGRLERVRGGRAYALLPPAPSSPVHEQQVEVLAPDGTSCGQLTFASAQPTYEPLVLGAEGGIVQQQPLAHPFPNGWNGCTLTRWPEILR